MGGHTGIATHCVAGSVSSPVEACGPSVSHLLVWPMAQVDEGTPRRVTSRREAH